MINLLIDKQLLRSQEELQALIKNDVKPFSDLLKAANQEPRVLKPLLNRYINWFNKTIMPIALKEITA